MATVAWPARYDVATVEVSSSWLAAVVVSRAPQGAPADPATGRGAMRWPEDACFTSVPRKAARALLVRSWAEGVGVSVRPTHSKGWETTRIAIC